MAPFLAYYGVPGYATNDYATGSRHAGCKHVLTRTLHAVGGLGGVAVVGEIKKEG